MTHLFDHGTRAKSPYVNGWKASGQVKFPDTDVVRGFNGPCRLEADIVGLEVDGIIPAEINGTFYRVQPDHRFPPLFEEDIHFNGDGNISAIRIQNGHVDFKSRYVRTDRFVLETKARKNLFGKYRNPFTDSESAKGVIRTAADTNVIFWRGMLLAMKEDGPPYAMGPATLETIGRYDFDGQVQSPTFAATPNSTRRLERWYALGTRRAVTAMTDLVTLSFILSRGWAKNTRDVVYGTILRHDS